MATPEIFPSTRDWEIVTTRILLADRGKKKASLGSEATPKPYNKLKIDV